jgi:hypothetical protein
MPRCTYMLPIRRHAFDASEASALRDYLGLVCHHGCDVLVIDGSPVDVFASHDRLWREICRHERVDSRFQYLNDKVNGIHTGVALAATEKIILADDDIRYRAFAIDRILQLLDLFEVVRPQNYLAALCSHRPVAGPEGPGGSAGCDGSQSRRDSPLPFWAKMEAARMLINRATLRTADYPGTCAFRRATMLACGEYDGDVLFDNEELIRHLARAGAGICYANDLFVAKRPPNFRKWIEQRPRQAYEDFGLRCKTTFFALLLPTLLGFALLDPRWLALVLVAVPVALAGLLRGEARKYFSLNICLYAPFWIVERCLSTYWAFYWFVTCGGYPFGDRLLSRGIGRDWIQGGKIAARQ